MKKILLYFFFMACVGCSHHSEDILTQKKLQLFEFPLKKYSKLIAGGFSGLYYQGLNAQDELVFWTHTDRGPNAESFVDKKSGREARPFVNPQYNPHLVQFSLDIEKQSIRYLKEIPLKLPNGELLTGLPNFKGSEGRTGDELALDFKTGQELPNDPLGIDPEGLCFMDQHIWMVEEYGPSILKFDLNGKLLTRIVPKGYYPAAELTGIGKKFGKDFILEALPSEIMTRRLNRGFEGLACHDGKLYTALQSPLSKDETGSLIFEFSTHSLQVERTITYRFESMKTEKIGDMSYQDGGLFIIEQNTKLGPGSFHKIFKIDPKKEDPKKKLVVDLVKLGLDFVDKVEGIAVLPSGHIYVLNDNDFGLTGAMDEKAHEPEVDSNRKSVLGLIQ